MGVRVGNGVRRVLITGGCSGFGAALVRRFSAVGHEVLITDVYFEAPAAGPAGAEYRRLDVRSEDDWDRAVAWCTAHWGGLDLLVNNASVATGGQIDEETLAEWDRVVDINLMGVVRGCRAFAPVFKAQRSGHIVNTASVAGLVHPPMMGSYNAVKAGVIALSETLLHELHPYDVSVSVVCPSYTRPDLTATIQPDGLTTRRRVERSSSTADEIAAVVVTAIEKRRFLIIPDRPALLSWRTKRFARPLYDRQMRRVAARARERSEPPAPEPTAPRLGAED